MFGEYYPPPAFYFTAGILGVPNPIDAQFKEISGLTAKMDTEDIVVGGENRFKYKVPTRASFDNLVLKRGLITSGSSLALWCDATLKTGLVTSVQTMDLVVMMLDETGMPLMTWTFIGAWPVKWSLDSLDSMDNKIAIETLEFAYSYFI
ncbi:MAG: phage tail protein [Bacteroidia bacterium]|jgi:phage tail-like protein|nr:phage tail protein [Bacteroidia bacterium]